jgi:hypothetical protein
MNREIKAKLKPYLAPILRIKHFKRVNELLVIRKPPEFFYLYYEYCKKLLLDSNPELKFDKGIYLVTVDYVDILPAGARYILVQYEHAIVKKEYPNQINEFHGDLLDCKESAEYKVRLIGKEIHYQNAELIIEYSMPNIKAVKNSELCYIYESKVIYIAPTYLELKNNWNSLVANQIIATMFGNPDSGRRKLFLEKLNESNVDSVNLMGNYRDFNSLLRRVALLINIHQSEFHNTLEELRILPALACGSGVVSEDSPYSDQVPYRKFINFGTQEQIIEFSLNFRSREIDSSSLERNRLDFQSVYRSLSTSNKDLIHDFLLRYKEQGC